MNPTDCSKPTLVCIYTRVSSKRQEEEGFSIEAQTELLEKYANENNMRIVMRFSDIYSAKAEGRKGFSELVKYLQGQMISEAEPKCITLLVDKTDRLYRNLKDWVIFDGLPINIHLVRESAIIGKNAHSSAQLSHGIRVLMAKNYIDNLSEETRKGMFQRAKEGLAHGHAPVGYLNIRGGDGKNRIETDDTTAPVIKKIFEKCAVGHASINDLLSFAKELGVKLNRSTLAKLLHNRFYMGEFTFNGTAYSGQHEPIISAELFSKVQSVLENRSKHKTRQQIHQWTFQGLIYCGCGSLVTVEKKKARYIYYHCANSRCPERGKSIREEKIIQSISELMGPVVVASSMTKWISENVLRSENKEDKERQGTIQIHQREITKLENRIGKAYEDKLDGRLTDEQFLGKKDAWEKEIEEKKKAVMQHEAKCRLLGGDCDPISLLNRLPEIFREGEDALKRKLTMLLFQNMTLGNRKICLAPRKPFDVLFSGWGTKMAS